jgi:hypothetical protein
MSLEHDPEKLALDVIGSGNRFSESDHALGSRAAKRNPSDFGCDLSRLRVAVGVAGVQ